MSYVNLLLEKANAAHGNDAKLEIECLLRICRLQFVKRYNSQLSDVFILLRAALVSYRSEMADISQRESRMVKFMELTNSRGPEWQLGATAPDRYSVAIAFMLMIFGQLINFQYLTVLSNPNKDAASVRKKFKKKITLRSLATIRTIMWLVFMFPYLAVVLRSVENAIQLTCEAIRDSMKKCATECEAVGMELIKKIPAKFDRSLTIEFEKMLFEDSAFVTESGLPSGIDCTSQTALFSHIFDTGTKYLRSDLPHDSRGAYIFAAAPWTPSTLHGNTASGGWYPGTVETPRDCVCPTEVMLQLSGFIVTESD